MINKIFSFGLFSSQFYFFKSGMPQLSHLLLSLFIGFILLTTVRSRWSIPSKFNEVIFVSIFYFIYTTLVNVANIIINESHVFIIDSVYTLFNVLLFSCVLINLENNNYKESMSSISFFGVVVLFFLCLTKIGKYLFGTRFTAFFNDPNQMSYWAICVCVIHLVLSRNIRLNVAMIMMCTFIVIEAQSRSGLIGLSFLYIGMFSMIPVRFKIVSSTGLLLVATLGSISMGDKMEPIPSSAESTNIINRLHSTDVYAQLQMRGYTRPIDYPEYLMFGSGKGMDERFNTNHEIHSSWIGVLFYYGIVGFVLFITLFVKIVKGLKLHFVIMSFAPLIYGISTYGLRTPIFWIMLAVISYSSLRIKNEI